MTLGEKIRRLRQGLHMTQKELAGDRITRNMLSQIESDTAAPSMKTLQYLAERLGVGVSSLLDTSDGASALDAARRRLRSGDPEQAIAFAEKVGGASEERRLILANAKLALSKIRLSEGKTEEAEELAEAALRENEKSLYASDGMRFELNSILAFCGALQGKPSEELLRETKEAYTAAGWEAIYHILLARDGMQKKQFHAAERELWLITALPDREKALYWITRGEIAMGLDRMGDALDCLKHAEASEIPGALLRRKLYALLESLYRETEDYKNAYLYAAKLRELDEEK